MCLRQGTAVNQLSATNRNRHSLTYILLAFLRVLAAMKAILQTCAVAMERLRAHINANENNMSL